MTDHPILFQGDMVRAILDGRKNQTRRVIKRLPIHADYGEPDWNKTWIDDSYNPPCLKVAYGGGPMGDTVQRHWCRYVPGDLLWVKDPFRIEKWDIPNRMVFGRYTHDDTVFANELTDDEWKKFRKWKKPSSGKSSLFMFKSLCRNWLKVKSVRVERVQKITSDGAVAEGCGGWREACGALCDSKDYEIIQRQHGVIKEFQKLWDSINAKRGYGWKVNPWVWVIEFERYDE